MNTYKRLVLFFISSIYSFWWSEDDRNEPARPVKRQRSECESGQCSRGTAARGAQRFSINKEKRTTSEARISESQRIEQLLEGRGGQASRVAPVGGGTLSCCHPAQVAINKNQAAPLGGANRRFLFFSFQVFLEGFLPRPSIFHELPPRRKM